MQETRRPHGSLLSNLALFVLPSCSATGQAQPPERPHGIEQFELANGLRVVIEPMPHVPMVTLMTSFDVGAADDPPGRSGFAHLFEHMMFKGSRHVKAGTLSDLLVEAGGGARALTTSDRTLFTSWARAEALELLIYLEAERMAGGRRPSSPCCPRQRASWSWSSV